MGDGYVESEPWLTCATNVLPWDRPNWSQSPVFTVLHHLTGALVLIEARTEIINNSGSKHYHGSNCSHWAETYSNENLICFFVALGVCTKQRSLFANSLAENGCLRAFCEILRTPSLRYVCTWDHQGLYYFEVGICPHGFEVIWSNLFFSFCERSCTAAWF